MNLHPNPHYRPIPVKAVIPRSLGTRSQKINPWITADEPAATICKTEIGYQLKEGEIRPTWQMYRVLTGQERKNHFGLVKLDPEKPSPTILSGVGGTTTGLVHPWEIRKLTINEAKALASYPKAFEIRGGYNARWARIGNSVPPLFMRSIALHIRREVLKRETHESLGTVYLPDREEKRSETC
jgi:site-specific DNA-cytosine methylase